MSCSKILLGDLPELAYKVINYLQNDYSTLYSCILVNRLWCRLAIPLLWENPFSISARNYSFIEIYLYDLEIINNSLYPNVLFNYSRFLKYLNIFKFIFSVDKWFDPDIRTSPPKNESCLVPISRNTITAEICVLLFKIFIENEITLHTLEIEICGNCYQPCFDNILELIFKNANFTHNIRNLNLFTIDDSSKYVSIKNRISQIIHLQQNLKKILLSNNSSSLYLSLLLSKDYNYSNTLNTIIFHRVNLNGFNNLQKVFEQLNVLESVHIAYCYYLHASFTQQIINLTKPFKLKSLFLSEIQQLESLELLLQKSGDYLENFGIAKLNNGLSSNQQLLELITKYCKNIKLFDFYVPISQIIYQIFNLIENIKQNLNYLSISLGYKNTGPKCCSIILRKLGQKLPPKLEYLCLNFYYIEASDFEVFLKNSKDTFINKLLINNSEGQDILPFIKEYIMKKKRVRYLAIKESILVKELVSFKDEANEFRLYNIKVQSYQSLEINLHNYIKEID
ncbi:uncharacterized protein OCT59_019058 [Rhizophagus irregularis]|uniref:F-box domain-containing protein n=2 Tax=Rhizophagus irregularis TaxID=588596 RepID=A0A015JD64_RHIIW|nr:hypothetical protein GLOIN_2v1873991 [Rhizophagus irregularis DAOM 181602=DAOM 197198]EXX64920.1 hypothetical protein RirG_138270 [Rhizophagus irregularis DAOM 197198w]POG73893.1 hypothetical protein GLOIN_2v1873991 [Rhizophagus irregularis DAOM 181602=DAOM 197198]UZO26845.1 hypothetical protein OCT59_019058 [Rhizophagus irregularis]GBC34064.2 hypothetical protein GLOIN_2v1873991 [Rhizophagus irregularis DAOM 181602=DAOM 197198]|eukprot:XP_025180759.1 hypothetical protein GLOIN_2v1873991 [Rhizophagus irregularis DAOM 181602=DAOM 197198]